MNVHEATIHCMVGYINFQEFYMNLFRSRDRKRFSLSEFSKEKLVAGYWWLKLYVQHKYFSLLSLEDIPQIWLLNMWGVLPQFKHCFHCIMRELLRASNPLRACRVFHCLPLAALWKQREIYHNPFTLESFMTEKSAWLSQLGIGP